MSGSLGLWSDPAGNAALEQPGAATFPASVWDSQDWFGLTRQIGRGIQRQEAEQGYTPGLAPGDAAFGVEPPVPPEEPLDTDALNAQFGVKGHLNFDAPLPASVAQSMYDAKRDELMRADAASRVQAGGLAKLGAGFIAGALDPTNIAAALMPVVGEARVAGMLARAGLDLGGEVAGAGVAGFAGRTALRAATGFLGGATAQAPLVALRYGLSQQEQADYGATDAMADILMGGVLGGGLHTAIGGAGDLLGRAFERTPAAKTIADDPAVREATARAAVAAVAEDRPVQVDGVIDHADATAERQQLENEWLARSQDSEDLRREISAVPDGAPPDEATTARLAAIEAEAAQPGTTAARAAALDAERTMLTEGAPASPDAEALERGRSDAQREGLQAAMARNEARIQEIERQLWNSDTAQQARGEPAPEFAASERAATEAAKAAPLERGAIPPEIAAHTDELQAFFKAADAAGIMDKDTKAELARLGELDKAGESEAAAHEMAAMCLVGRA